jgi:hypothetical protein
MSKDEKKINYIKRCKKTLIKRMRVKTKLIRGCFFFNWRVKLNWKIALTKGKKIKRIRVKLKKIKQQKIWLNDEIETQKKL